MRRYSRRQFLSTAAIAGAASLLAACAQAAPTKAPVEQGPTPVVATEVPKKEEPTAAPAPSGPVEVSLPYLTFDSFDHAYWTSQLLLAQGTIFEGLFGYDDKLNIVPKICESYTVSDDYKVFTYKLRTDKKWANGDPVTARDFYNAWMRFMSNELQDTPMWAGAWSYIQNAWAYKSGACEADEVGVKLIGDDVIEVTLNQPFPSFSNALVMAQAMPIHSKTLEEHPTDWWRPEYKAFNGPFIVDEWVAGGETKLVRNPNYVGERYGNVDVIYLKPFSDPNALIQAFENGELQYAGLGDASQVAYVKNHPTLKDGYREEIAWNWSGLQFDRAADNGPMSNIKVRLAFAMAIDKATIVEKVLRGLAIPANAFTGDQDIASKVTPLEYNPSKARDLLAEAGYADPKSLGTVTIFAPPANSNEMAFVEAVAKMWQENLGVDVTIQNMDWGPYSSLQWSDVNRDIPWGYSTMGGAINFIEPMGLYQNVGHIWWFMEYDPEWNKTRYWYWRDKDNAVDSLTAVGDFAELEDRANAAWNKRLEIVAAENNDWGKSMMVEPTFRQQFDRIAERFRNATSDAEKVEAYKNALRLVIGEERSLDNIAHMTETNKQAQRLMASLFLAKMDECDPLLVQLNQLAVDSAWMIPLYIGKITYVVDPKLSGIVQNKLSWGNIFQFQYLNYQ